jgi:integral membrane protein
MGYTDVRWFRLAAIAEAISWAGLLIGMFFKYVVVQNAIGVQIFGPIHGAMFLFFVATALWVRRSQRWSWLVTAVALLSSIPPFGSVLFERWATRTGRLADRAPEPAQG